jgi:serine protease Do
MTHFTSIVTLVRKQEANVEVLKSEGTLVSRFRNKILNERVTEMESNNNEESRMQQSEAGYSQNAQANAGAGYDQSTQTSDSTGYGQSTQAGDSAGYGQSTQANADYGWNPQTGSASYGQNSANAGYGQTTQPGAGSSNSQSGETQQNSGFYRYSNINSRADNSGTNNFRDYVSSGNRNPYSGYGNNINGMEARYDSQRMSRTAEAENGNSGESDFSKNYGESGRNEKNNENRSKGSSYHTEESPKKKKRSKSKKGGKNGYGMKLLGVAAAAVVFGLVAAAVFQGTRYGTDKLLGNNETEVAAVDSSGDEETGSTTESNTPQLTQASTEETSTVYDVASVAKKVMPSIVSITGTYVTTYDYWFNSYQQESTGCGSGIIIGKDDDYLYLATNYHVVEDAKSLSVTFVDDESADATVKGYVENNDIAVVTVKLSDISDSTLEEISEIQVGSSDSLNVGDPCVAIGNALGYGQSVTVGYISALDREISTSDETVTVLQTDAAINPGNSGGALVNMKGELIGINTAKYSDTSVEGMGYALPISDVQDIINDLIAGKDVDEDGTATGDAYLGIVGQTITDQYSQLLGMPEGVYVSSVESGSAAEECGLTSGDIICSIDGEDVTDMETLHEKIVSYQAGDKITIVYYRNNNGNYEKQTATATLQAKE